MESWMEFFSPTSAEGILHLIGAATTLLTVAVVAIKTVKNVVWMYSTDESDFDDNAKLVLCELRQPLSHLKNNCEKIERVGTNKVTVTCRPGWFRRKPLVVVHSVPGNAQGDRDISRKLTVPERRVISRVVRSRLVDARRKKEQDDVTLVRNSLTA